MCIEPATLAGGSVHFASCFFLPFFEDAPGSAPSLSALPPPQSGFTLALFHSSHLACSSFTLPPPRKRTDARAGTR